MERGMGKIVYCLLAIPIGGESASLRNSEFAQIHLAPCSDELRRMQTG